MNNYNLKAIKEMNEHTYLETSFYWGPGLPVFASKESIKDELKSCLKVVQHAFCKSENHLWRRWSHRADFGFSRN